MRIKTCLRYPGGKFYGLKKIKPFLSVEHDEYREVFAGGASIFLGKDLAKKVNWINDKDKELYIFYKVIQNPKSRKKLIELLSKEEANRERHKEVLDFKPKSDLEVAFKYFYLNRTSFSGIMYKPRWGYLIGSSVTPDHWGERIEPVGKILEDVKITNLDFRKVINFKSKNNVLLYLDPPYYQAAKSIYKNEFTHKDHVDLANLLKKTKYKFILSYEDCPGVRNLYKWANVHEIDFKYFMSEGRRDTGKELIITNFEVSRTP
jgi:DNA adenine methylase